MKKYRVTRFKRIYIEITSSCNLTCSFCQETKRDKRFMSIDEFSHVIEQVKPLTEFIYLHVKGEPLLHPQLGDILQICHDEGMRVNITTNGTLLKKQLEENDEEELINMLIDEPIAVDVDKQSDSTRTFGDKLADKLTEVAGSWTFIISMIIFLIFWIILNLYLLDKVDPYPFVLLNLVLSCIAALQAPIIMMSQNREAKKDRLRSSNDYKTDLKSELILEELHSKMNKIIKNQNEILKYLNNDKK